MQTHKTTRLTVAQALIQYLQVQYSERDGQTQRLISGMFGIFGHGNVAALSQALYEYGDDLPYYQPKNEQSMVHTAVGYAKASKRLSTMACTSSIGPGSTNMLTGAALAHIDRLPVLLLPSDYYVTRHQGPVLQQLEHAVSADVSVNDCFRPISRFFDRISRPEQLLTALPEAMRVLTDPAVTGPVTLSLPQDVQAHAYDYPSHFFEKRIWRVERRFPHPQSVSEAAALIRNAVRPVIIAGGGVHYSDACDELQQFAETFGIPVVETYAGKGAMKNPSLYSLGGHGSAGNPAAGEIVGKADLVLCVGTRLIDFITGSQSCFRHPEVRFVHINVCGHDAYKQGAYPLVADALEALKALSATLSAAGVLPNESYRQEIVEHKGAWEQRVREEIYRETPGEMMRQGQLLGILNEAAQSGDTVIAASGSAPGDLLNLWDASGGKTCHIEYGFSCMGYEIPAALGVRMVQPEGEVYVYVGDGTYLMNPTELVTAAQEQLKMTVVLSDNHGFQCIRRLQVSSSGRSFGNEFRMRDSEPNRLVGEFMRVDYAKNAESMGARVWNVATPEEFRQALQEARIETRTCMIVIETQTDIALPGSGIWWDVAPPEVSNDKITQEIRAKYEENRGRLQRFHY